MESELVRPQSINTIIENNPELDAKEALRIQQEQTASYLVSLCGRINRTREELHEMGGDKINRLLEERAEERAA